MATLPSHWAALLTVFVLAMTEMLIFIFSECISNALSPLVLHLTLCSLVPLGFGLPVVPEKRGLGRGLFCIESSNFVHVQS